MLKQRVVTAVVMAVLFLVVLFTLNPAGFALAMAVVVAVAGWEWANLAGYSAAWQRWLYGAGVAALALGTWFFTLPTDPAAEPERVKSILMLACVWWAVALLWVQSYPSSAVLWDRRWLKSLMGFVVLVPAWLGLVYLHASPMGHWLVFLVMSVVACADISAYFSGKAFGRRKLAPNVSPGKSWEGFFGGVLGCLLLALLIGWAMGDVNTLVALVLPACVVSVLGDLSESMLKRQRGIKDSSQLLPGHGGLLDRIDGVTAAAPVFALAVIMTGWTLA